jgi:hypothetical protein
VHETGVRALTSRETSIYLLELIAMRSQETSLPLWQSAFRQHKIHFEPCSSERRCRSKNAETVAQTRQESAPQTPLEPEFWRPPHVAWRNFLMPTAFYLETSMASHLIMSFDRTVNHEARYQGSPIFGESSPASRPEAATTKSSPLRSSRRFPRLRQATRNAAYHYSQKPISSLKLRTQSTTATD